MTEEERAEAARRLVAFRQRAEGTCEVCGKPFTGYANGNRRKRFCSANCRARAHYLATRAAPPAEGEADRE